MRFSRAVTNRANVVLDDWLPPRLRDSRPFVWAARRLYDRLPIEIDELKDVAFSLSRAQYADFYQRLQSKLDQGDTDLTAASLDGVLDAVVGETVLDVACGKGDLLARLRSVGRRVVGCDVAVSAGDRAIAVAGLALCEGLVEQLPFADGAFDTVVSTHTLEHVQHLQAALGELRRVARRRVIVVVPRQRPYRVTFNPHIHFFPYRWSLLAWTGTDRVVRCDLVGGDWLYIEDRPA